MWIDQRDERKYIPLTTLPHGKFEVYDSTADILAALREPAVAEMVQEASRRGLAALLVGVSNEAQALEVQDLLERTAAVKVIDRHGGQHAS